jgi:hypothetical protein
VDHVLVDEGEHAAPCGVVLVVEPLAISVGALAKLVQRRPSSVVSFDGFAGDEPAGVGLLLSERTSAVALVVIVDLVSLDSSYVAWLS